jgi:hypothetical protein
MNSKLLMVSGMAIVGLTACSLNPLGKAKVAAVPPALSVPGAVPGTVPRTVPIPGKIPVARPPALPNPTLIAPAEAATLGTGVGGRPDPFSALPMTPTVIVKQNSDPIVPSVAPSIISAAPGLQPFDSAAAAQQTLPQALPQALPPIAVSAAPVPPVVVAPAAPIAPVVVAPPPPPAPSLAQTIAVSGIVQAGSRTSIIVQVPHETSSRYAVVGDYLGNGKVLVKRIEMQGTEPIVVLEQDGAEFIKPVGSGSL